MSEALQNTTMDWILQIQINDDGNYLLLCIGCRGTQVERKTQASLFPVYTGNVKLEESWSISSTQPDILVWSIDMNKIVIICFENWRFKITEKYSLWSCMFLLGNSGRAQKERKKEKGSSGVLDLAEVLVETAHVIGVSPGKWPSLISASQIENM